MSLRFTTPLADALASAPAGHERERTNIETRLRSDEDIESIIRGLHAQASTLMDGDRSFFAMAQWMDRVRAELEALPEYQAILELRKEKEKLDSRVA